MARNRIHLFASFSAVALLAMTVGCNRSTPEPNPATATRRDAVEIEPLAAATIALQRGELSAAETAIAKHLLTQPSDPKGLELAGDIAAAQEQLPKSIELYQSAIDASDAASAELYEKLARTWMNRGAPYDAAGVLQQSLSVHPDNAKVRADYAGLVASLGMVRDAPEHLRWLLRRGQGGMNELIMLANLSIPQTDTATCNYALEKNFADRRPLYALAVVDAYEGRYDEAAEKVAEVTAEHPSFDPAWALLGRSLVEIGDRTRFEDWQSNVPESASKWVEYWMAAGLYAEQESNHELASRAFWEAIKIDDCHGEALAHLSANLLQIGRTEEAKLVAERSADVNALHDAVESLFSWRSNSQSAALSIAEAVAELGRPWEAEAWARASLAMTQQLDPQAAEKHRQYFSQLESRTPWQLPQRSLLARIDLSDLPDFQWLRENRSIAEQSFPDSSGAAIRFADEATSRGLVHTVEISKRTPEASIPIYQSNAGGAGVIDFDLDGWPDVYLSMVDGTPMRDDSAPNQLFRNHDGQFVSVAEPSGVGDRGFTQGVAVGDYNDDGFPDLLVANIGSNRLYRNNGDGTFRDVTDEAGMHGERWSTSVAIADVNSDGHADLIEICYCAGNDPYSQQCIDADVNQSRSCSPLVFKAEADRIWAGQGDGTFRDASETWLPDSPPGHGLGLLVGQIDDQPGLDLYVANDMTANQFWSADETDQGFRLTEQASIRGLAVNRRSESQASMGMAIGDADLDGDDDIFLTHFTDDYNTLYEQISPGTWFDRTGNVGLADPTIKQLAFGTEWIDADNNGSLELMIANGNVDDFSHQGLPLRMRPQLFVRQPTGRWIEIETIGQYFEREVVGRALAVADFDRDGRRDVVITHIYDPVSLLMNQTRTENQSVRITLKATASQRDAIGAVVTGMVNGVDRNYQLTAGDGFQCSNQRCIAIGLGAGDAFEDVRIQWPSGNEQLIGSLAGGVEYVLVEGDEPFWNSFSLWALASTHR